MVKGVNKRVIEVNDTGSKFFEKIVFYVTPEYSELTPAQLKSATEFLSLKLEGSPKKLLSEDGTSERRGLLFGVVWVLF